MFSWPQTHTAKDALGLLRAVPASCVLTLQVFSPHTQSMLSWGWPQNFINTRRALHSVHQIQRCWDRPAAALTGSCKQLEIRVGSWTSVLCKQYVLITIEPSLQPLTTLFKLIYTLMPSVPASSFLCISSPFHTLHRAPLQFLHLPKPHCYLTTLLQEPLKSSTLPSLEKYPSQEAGEMLSTGCFSRGRRFDSRQPHLKVQSQGTWHAHLFSMGTNTHVVQTYMQTNTIHIK